MKSLILATTLLSVTLASEIKVTNNCPHTIWPGIQADPGKSLPANGGFELGSYQSRTLYVEDTWSGRIWTSTDCELNFGTCSCQTGDCGGLLECAGNGPIPPATSAEFRLNGYGGLDYYFVNLVNGYNLPLKIYPTSGYRVSNYSPYDCQAAGCIGDVNAICPDVLAVKGENGATIACKSACLAFNRDKYCCRDYFSNRGTCNAKTWPINYTDPFKKACPTAYATAFDDNAPTFSCKGNPNANYEVVFCPKY